MIKQVWVKDGITPETYVDLKLPLTGLVKPMPMSESLPKKSYVVYAALMYNLVVQPDALVCSRTCIGAAAPAWWCRVKP